MLTKVDYLSYSLKQKNIISFPQNHGSSCRPTPTHAPRARTGPRLCRSPRSKSTSGCCGKLNENRRNRAGWRRWPARGVSQPAVVQSHLRTAPIRNWPPPRSSSRESTSTIWTGWVRYSPDLTIRCSPYKLRIMNYYFFSFLSSFFSKLNSSSEIPIESNLSIWLSVSLSNEHSQ